METTSPGGDRSLLATPIRDLGLTIAGTWLEPVIVEFQHELERVGIRRMHPVFYLSTEWGVSFGSIAIALPFYLARADLTALHAERIGYLEGGNRADLLRYLRHEMGHVVNYAYHLHEQEEWAQLFGSMTQLYDEDYRPQAFSRRYVRHLPGWYAQKHPDEDWSETFAVWMTPNLDWRAVYAECPEVLAKLEYCNRIMPLVSDCDPKTTLIEFDVDVRELTATLEQYYAELDAFEDDPFPAGLAHALRSLFEDFVVPEGAAGHPAWRQAADLLTRLEPELVTQVYRWTGHLPERARELVTHFIEQARRFSLLYPADREPDMIAGLTALITALGMNYVPRGQYGG